MEIFWHTPALEEKVFFFKVAQLPRKLKFNLCRMMVEKERNYIILTSMGVRKNILTLTGKWQSGSRKERS